MSVNVKQPQEVQRIFACLNCDLEYENASSARRHMQEIENIVIKYVWHGKRQQDYKFVKTSAFKKYACPTCFSLSPTKDLYRAHYHYMHETGEQITEEQTSHPFSNPLTSIENSVEQPKKRKKTTIEAVRHLMGNENQSTEILSAVMKASKLATSCINISSEKESEDIYFFSSPKELVKINKFEDRLVKFKTETCIVNESPSPISNTRTLPDDYLHQTLYNSESYSFMLELDTYTEISTSERDMLNKDWLYGNEVRLACAQLLGGAILVDGEQVLFINTVEVYARSSILDAHHERLNPVATFSSIPTPTDYYQTLSVVNYENDGSKKLIIGTYSFNALITSSLRLDISSDLETGPSTKKFIPSRNTKIFIAETSRNAANDIIKKKKKLLYDFDILHQIRQVRSRLTSPSTYLSSRACSLLTNNIACRPYTVFTIIDYGTNSTNTDEMVACMVLRLVATNIMNNVTTLTKPEIDSILEFKKGDTVVLKIIKSISSLIKENGSIPILHNNELEVLLNTLANIVTPKLPTFNEQVQLKFKQRMEMLKKVLN